MQGTQRDPNIDGQPIRQNNTRIPENYEAQNPTRPKNCDERWDNERDDLLAHCPVHVTF